MTGILSRAVNAGKTLLGRQPAGRMLTVFPDDTFLVSFPKSGNTWARFLVANLLYPRQNITFANIESFIPEISAFPDRVLRRAPRPRVLKSHQCFDPVYRRVVYIVRDPRDVLLSHYHFNMKRRNIPDGYSIDLYVPRFMISEFNPRIGCWQDHVLSWLAPRHGQSGFLVLRYEDMLEDTERELAKVARLLGIEASPDDLSRAVGLSSADRMRSLEKEQATQWQQTKGSRPDIPFIRTAVSGKWRSELSPPCVRVIESAWGPTMQRLGYQLSEDPEAKPRQPSACSASRLHPFSGEK